MPLGCASGRERHHLHLQVNPASMTAKQKAWQWLLAHSPVGRRTLMSIRFEAGSQLQRLRNALNPAYHRKVAALRRMSGVSVNFGSGGRGIAGWINIDVSASHADQYIAHDIRRPLPLRDGQARRVFAEHVVEHLDFRHEIPRVLAEFRRILEPGGALRIVVPDAARFLQAYAAGSREQFKALGWDLDRLPDDIFTPMHVVNHIYHQEGEHFFGWDFETMEWALLSAGFKRVVRQSFGHSLDPELAIDQPNHSLYSLYVDAIR